MGKVSTAIFTSSSELPLYILTHNKRRTDENWTIFHAQYINMWNNRHEPLPTREAIVAPELAYDPKYMQWFRVYGKPCMIEEEVRGRQPHVRRPRQAPIHPRSGEMGLSSASTQELTSMATPPPD
ncbi:hypothetical protein PVK06_041019 [Gossypium arboreum]|uniref:Uncharacterized protein n=1 Tax=Gossypium arboreum TaxID=29729 RepID=A0ABR0N723_GOSAR|nr:hypothetical protein PVK06_041019 [Gossypium arboreum]